MPSPPPLAPIRSRSRKDSVVDAIRRAVVVGALKPGERLTEVSLASMLGVSRHTVREAINLLVSDGMLEQEPYTGIRVTELVPQDLLSLARTRQALDMIAVTAIIDDTSGRRMEAFLRGWETFAAVAFDSDPLARSEGHLAFHEQMWVASEDSMLLRIWPVVRAQVTVALAQDAEVHADSQRAYDVHLRLVEAIRSRDLAVSEAELYRHTVESAAETAAQWALREAEDAG